MLQRKDKKKLFLFKEPVFKVAELIFTYPNKSFHIRLLEKKTGFSTTAIVAAIEELEEHNLIIREETTLTKNIKANLDAEEYRFYKRICNIYRLKTSGFVDELIKMYNFSETIVLFGSFAKGEDIEESDIDILVVSAHKSPKKINNVSTYETTFQRKINVHIIPNFKKSSKEFKNTIANGIVLYGYLKVA